MRKSEVYTLLNITQESINSARRQKRFRPETTIDDKAVQAIIGEILFPGKITKDDFEIFKELDELSTFSKNTEEYKLRKKIIRCSPQTNKMFRMAEKTLYSICKANPSAIKEYSEIYSKVNNDKDKLLFKNHVIDRLIYKIQFYESGLYVNNSVKFLKILADEGPENISIISYHVEYNNALVG